MNGLMWVNRHIQPLLRMVLHGPIDICCSCRCLLMNPLVSQQVVPIASSGPMGNYRQRQLHMLMGLQEAICNSSRLFRWAYQNKQLLLPMVSHGPIGMCGCCCQRDRIGPLVYTAASVNGPTRSHPQQQLLISMSPSK